MRLHHVALLASLAATAGCRGPRATAEPSAEPTPSAAPVASSSAAPAAPAGAAKPGCAALGCRLFDSPAQAFRAILDEKPIIVAIGEAHAQKGAEGVPSSAKRFTTELLPTLEGRASDLLVELMAPPSGCKAKAEAVRKKQKVVTERQADTNQNEYVTMGNEARKRGVVPDLLRPTCADMDAINTAGPDAIAASLTTIARLTKVKVKALVDRNTRAGAEKIVVTYGGAMHNDATPPRERAEWSFGPDLSAHVGESWMNSGTNMSTST